ncbi:MAG: class II fructose-bisphosphate aldolase [Gammaproteobacteria bacterium]|nr:class II fructose-bisphosphate aldolase [Gammaproteobacteria bacterium]
MQPTQDYAVACFNVFGYEDALAVVQAAEARQASVILSVNLDMTQFMPVQHITAMLRPLAEDAKVPVCLHLDHHYEIEQVKQAIRAGFTSVMFDGSQLPIADNIAGVAEVVELARKHKVSVEAEVGSVPYASGRDHIKSALTQVSDAIAMAKQGQPDVLAISVGNVHRLENNTVDIDYMRFEEISTAVDLPLVIHGTSGIKPLDIQKLASSRVGKFNIGTVLRQRFGHAIRNALNTDPQLFDRLTIMRKAIPEVQAEAEYMIRLLGQ